MQDFDRDALKRSLRALPSSDTLRNCGVTRRNVQPDLAAINRQMRKETIGTLEAALTQAGVDVRKLRVAPRR
jgi:hypothetical protein